MPHIKSLFQSDRHQIPTQINFSSIVRNEMRIKVPQLSETTTMADLREKDGKEEEGEKGGNGYDFIIVGSK